MSFHDTLDSIANSIGEHLPDILLGTSMAAGLGATVYGIAVTPKALDKIYDYIVENVPEEERRGLRISELPKLLPFKVKFKLLWKIYVPTAIGWAVSLGTGIASDVVHNRNEAAFATLATATEATLRDFKDSTKEVVGEKKFDEIDANAAQKRIDRERAKGDDYIEKNTIRINKKANPFTLIDDVCGRRYVVDLSQLERAEHQSNKMMRAYDWLSLNDFYFQLNVPSIAIGNDIGWHIMDGELDIVNTYRGGLDDGVPVGVLRLLDNMRIRTVISGTDTYLRIRGC